MYILTCFFKDKVSIGTWIYFWTFYFVPLIYISVFVPVPYCLDDCDFVVEPEVRQVDSSSSILLCQDCFGYLRFFLCVYGVRKCSSFILLQVVDKFSQHHLLKRFSFLHYIFLPPLSKIRCPYVCGFISGLSILFHWSICRSLCQYHTVLMTVAL